jgi:hypothetical protein
MVGDDGLERQFACHLMKTPSVGRT